MASSVGAAQLPRVACHVGHLRIHEVRTRTLLHPSTRSSRGLPSGTFTDLGRVGTLCRLMSY